MKTFLLTVASAEPAQLGLRLTPGFFKADVEARPAMKMMMQGCTLELRRPDGTTLDSHLVTYGVSVEKQPDGSFIYYGDPKDPEIKLTIAAEAADVPAGTEVWLVDPTA